MRRIVLACSFIAVVLSSMAQAKDSSPVSLAMTSKWEINYDTDSCHLLAQFGEGDGKAILQMTRFEPGNSFDLMLYGKMFTAQEPWISARLGFGDQSLVERIAGSGSSGKLPFVIITQVRLDLTKWPKVVPQEEMALVPLPPGSEANTTSLTVAIDKNTKYKFETGSLAKPMQAMRDCTADLLTSWGYDPKIQAALSRRATPLTSPGSWLSDGDYPSMALFAGYSGLVQFRLDVDPSGKMTGCHILRTFKPDDFTKATCDALKRRARFKPALDAAGTPVASYYINAARFVIPT